MYALVTGASAGIGMEIAKYLSILGYDLILTARSEDKLQDLRKTILKRFPDRTVLVIPADLSKREECFRLYKEACERAGEENIEFVANNAGKGVYGLFLETDLDAELELIDLNVASVHILSKLFLRDMVRRGHGTLMNVGSCAGFMSGPTFSSYYASKNYVVRLTEAIHEELRRAKSPVKVSCLCPGPVNTEFNEVADVSFALPGISVQECVDYALRMMARRQTVIIPGRQIRAAVIGQRLIPTALTVRITAAQQKKKMEGPASETSAKLENA